MPSAIETRITLAGLEDAKAKLTETGEAGEAAFGKINKSSATASESTSSLGEAFAELGEKLGLPVGAAEKLFETLGHLDFTAGLAGLGALGAAVAAAGVAFLALGEHAAVATRDIENHARILGMTGEAFEGVLYAAGQVGVGAEAANRGLDRLQVTIGRVREEQEKLANGGKVVFDSTEEIIKQLAAGHTAGLDTLAATADAFNLLTDETAKAALGHKLFNRGWAEMLPLLALGGDALRAQAKRWDELKISATDAEKQMAGRYAAAANELKLVTEGLGNAVGNVIGQLFSPGLAALAEALAGAEKGIRDFAQAFVDELRGRIEIVSAAVRGFVEALSHMTAIINRTFGTDFSAVMIAATALLLTFARPVAAITAAFLVLEYAIKTVFGPNSPINAAQVAGYIGAFVGLVYMVKSLAAALALLWLNPLGFVLAGVLAISVALLAINGPIKAIAEAIRKYIGDDAAATFESFASDIQSGWEHVKAGFLLSLDDMGAAFDKWLENSHSAAAGLLRVIERIASALGSAPGTAAEPDVINPGPNYPYATGGRVPGSGTGDIVRALLTPGEFVHRVAAVDYYGLDFMRGINNLQIPRFDVGGLVGSIADNFAPMQHFASGGLVAEAAGGGSGRAPVHLHLNGQEYALETDARTADRLVRFARGEVIRRAGRKPSWTP